MPLEQVGSFCINVVMLVRTLWEIAPPKTLCERCRQAKPKLGVDMLLQHSLLVGGQTLGGSE